MYHLEMPAHCFPNATTHTMEEEEDMEYNIGGGGGEEDYLTDLLSSDGGCYDNLRADEQAAFLKYEVIVGGYCNCLVGLVGLLGNLLSLVVLSQKEMQKNNCFNKLLIGVVTSDSLHIVFGVMESFRNSFPSLYPDALLLAFPWFHYPFYRITLCASIYMVVAVAIERYLAVCFPHDYQGMSTQSNRALYYILPAIFNAFFFNVPRFFETEAKEITYWTDNCTNVTTVEVVPTELRLDRNYIIIYVNWVWTISTGILPFAALLLLNCKIFLGLKAVRRNLNRHQRLADAGERRESGLHSGTSRQQQHMRNGKKGGEEVPLVVLNNGTQNLNDYDEEDEDEDDMEMTMATTTGASGGGGGILTPSRSMRSGRCSPAVNLGGGGGNETGGRAAAAGAVAAAAAADRQPSSLRQRARTAAQRRLMSAAQSREANMAVVLVCTVTMFLICHLPRMFIVVFEASTVNQTLDCRKKGLLGIPVWFLYVTPVMRFLQVLNASVNFPIYYLMGNSFRTAMHGLFKKE